MTDQQVSMDKDYTTRDGRDRFAFCAWMRKVTIRSWDTFKTEAVLTLIYGQCGRRKRLCQIEATDDETWSQLEIGPDLKEGRDQP